MHGDPEGTKMPAPGQITGRFNKRASSAEQAYAEALRSLCRHITYSARARGDGDGGVPSQKEICNLIGVRLGFSMSQTALSRQLSANARADLLLGQALLELAQGVELPGPPDGKSVPISLAELKELHARAVEAPLTRRRPRRKEETSNAGDSAALVGVSESAALASPSGPADGFEEPADERLVGPSGLPVPSSEGDRQADEALAVPWGPLQSVLEGRNSGKSENARTALFYLGEFAHASEAAAGVMACRTASLHEAADTILSHAARRKPEGVLDMARHLTELGAFEDVRLLLRQPATGR